jgi:hypothetical protein
MTPQEEQLAMQNFVKARLLQQGRLNLMPGQVPLAPEDQEQFLQRPPLAPGVTLPGGGDPGSFPDSPVPMSQPGE